MKLESVEAVKKHARSTTTANAYIVRQKRGTQQIDKQDVNNHGVLYVSKIKIPLANINDVPKETTNEIILHFKM